MLSITIDCNPTGRFAPAICATSVNDPALCLSVYRYAAVPKSFELTTYQVSVTELYAIPFTAVCPDAMVLQLQYYLRLMY